MVSEAERGADRAGSPRQHGRVVEWHSDTPRPERGRARWDEILMTDRTLLVMRKLNLGLPAACP